MDECWRILIIDDDGRFRCRLASVLERWAAVRVVDTVDAAVRLLSQWEPQVVVLDPVLRSGDSVELLVRLVHEARRIVFCALRRRACPPPSTRARTVIYLPRDWSAGALGSFIERQVRVWLAESGPAPERGAVSTNGYAHHGSPLTLSLPTSSRRRSASSPARGDGDATEVARPTTGSVRNVMT